MGWEDHYLPPLLNSISTGEAPPSRLDYDRRQSQMTANHLAMWLTVKCLLGNPEPLREWFRDQLTAGHQGPEQGGTVYPAFYEVVSAAAAVHAHRIGDPETLRLAREWWLDHLAIYWACRLDDWETGHSPGVLMSGSRSSRPSEWGQGAVLRAMNDRPTNRDLAVGATPEGPTGQLWAVMRALSLGALEPVSPTRLADRRPPLLYPMTIWRSSHGMGSWTPTVSSPRSQAQWGAGIAYGFPRSYGDPGGRNPEYTRGPKRGGRDPQTASTEPGWLAIARRLDARGAAVRIDLGPPPPG